MTSETSKDNICANCGHPEYNHTGISHTGNGFCMWAYCKCKKFKPKDNICAKCGHKKDWHCLCEEKFKPQKSDFQKEIEQDAKRLNEIYDKHQNHSPQNVTTLRENNDKSNGHFEDTNNHGSDDASSLRGKKYFADAVRKYAHNNKDKIREKAKKVYHKDKTKQLVRANTNHNNEKLGICSKCKEKGKTEFHHFSYEPNLFIEVCKKCHNQLHGRKYYGR